MRLIVKFNDDLVVWFSKIEDIINHDDYIALTGNIVITVNCVDLFSVCDPIGIDKSLLLASKGVFLDFTIEEVKK